MPDYPVQPYLPEPLPRAFPAPSPSLPVPMPPTAAPTPQGVGAYLGTRGVPRAPRAARFANAGDRVQGRILWCGMVPLLVYGSRDTYQTNPDGSPVLAPRIDLATDDGTLLCLYVHGSSTRGSGSMLDAVSTALAEAAMPEPRAGDTLAVEYVGEQPSSNAAWRPRKTFRAVYLPADRQV